MGWAAHSHSGHLLWDYSQLLECLITPEGDKEGKDLLGKPNLGWIFGVNIIFFPSAAGMYLLDQGKKLWDNPFFFFSC